MTLMTAWVSRYCDNVSIATGLHPKFPGSNTGPSTDTFIRTPMTSTGTTGSSPSSGAGRRTYY